VLLLGLVFVPGFIPKGGATANRWVEILGFSFQPAELLKFSLILLVADFLSKKSTYDLND
jgi:cell division protein FtsW